MNIGIVGFGKMGKQIFSCCSLRGIGVKEIIDPVSADGLVTSKSFDRCKGLSDCDVLIDFSSPSCIIDNLKYYSQSGIPAVVGTTGWYDRIDEVKSFLTAKSKIIYSGNFSVGVAVFLRLVKRACEIFDRIPSYDVAIREVHHTAKADSPSGTAKMISDVVISRMSRKTKVIEGNAPGKIPADSVQIVSQRVGSEPGLHDVIFDSEPDTITLSHHARSRSGFAFGALDAAEWLLRQKPGLYCIDDFINELTGENV